MDQFQDFKSQRTEKGAHFHNPLPKLKSIAAWPRKKHDMVKEYIRAQEAKLQKWISFLCFETQVLDQRTIAKGYMSWHELIICKKSAINVHFK